MANRANQSDERKKKMITRDIKAALVAKLVRTQKLLASGDTQEADYQLSDIIDDMLSSMVSVTYSREEDNRLPGECEDASELVARNVD
jgi:hypothetical protein